MPAVEPHGLWTLGFLGVLVLSIAWVLLRSLAPGPQRAGSPSPVTQVASPPRPPAAAQPAGLSEESLQATARELAARLDARIRQLESLLRDADRVADRLEAAVAAAARSSEPPFATNARTAAAGTPSQPMPPAEPPDSLAQASPRALPGQAEGLKGVAVLATFTSRGQSPLPAAHAGPPRSPRYEPIHALADQGCPPEEIARRTGIPLGEVQLVLNLRRVQTPATPF